MLLLLPLLLLAAAAPSAVQGFQPPAATLAGARRQPSHSRLAAASSSSSSASTDAPKQATLDSRTPWQLSLTLTREGFDPVRGELLLRFVQTPNYEPPQVNQLHACWCCVVRIAGVYLGAPTYPETLSLYVGSSQRRESTPTDQRPQGRIFVERDSLALVATDEKGFGALCAYINEGRDGLQSSNNQSTTNQSQPLPTHTQNTTPTPITHAQPWGRARRGRCRRTRRTASGGSGSRGCSRSPRWVLGWVIVGGWVGGWGEWSAEILIVLPANHSFLTHTPLIYTHAHNAHTHTQYPFIYFSLHTEEDARVLLESETARDEQGKRTKELTPLFDGVGVPGNRLDFRFDHKRDQGRVVLSEGKVTFKEVEMRKVDPLGIGGVVNVGDVVDAGSASLTPVLQAS